MSKTLTSTYAIKVINDHIPSLTDENEAEIIDNANRSWTPGTEEYAADLAIRTCKCGKRIDGFYEYVDHLKEVFRGA